MKTIVRFPRIIFIVVFLTTYFIAYLSGIESPILRTLFSITLAFVLSPRKKTIQTQSGEKIQITWLFLKEPIFID